MKLAVCGRGVDTGGRGTVVGRELDPGGAVYCGVRGWKNDRIDGCSLLT